MLNLPQNGQGHQSVMIYIHIVVLESLMPSSIEIGRSFPEKIFEGFLPCDLDYLYTHWLPRPIDDSHKIWL